MHHTIIIDNTATGEELLRETLRYASATEVDRRSADLWNEHCAHRPGRGLRLRVFDGSGGVVSTIDDEDEIEPEWEVGYHETSGVDAVDAKKVED
jgi:hypothetical protein